MTIETIFITQIASIIAFVAMLFVLYRLLVSQKDAVIELLKERLAAESSKVLELKTQAPDTLVSTLDSRIQIMNKELDRLKHDGTTTTEVVTRKEQELSSVREQLLKLSELFQDSDLVCPDCSSALAHRAFQNISSPDGESDADIEYRVYECGAEYCDSQQTTPCKNAEQAAT